MAPDGPEAPAHAARLAGARSAYLKSAAEQSIDWFPWGPEPFALARSTGRPVLLDIGAAWCHWCHVMDETTYADGEVARLLARDFVAVKVDRDEHPEIDRRYQRQVGALTGEGGWPLTAFLTPDGEVFLGGTFFPPDDGHGRPGFRRVLQEVARLWKEEPDRIRANTQGIQAALGRLRSARSEHAGPTVGFGERIVAEIRGNFDPAHGGFGTAPKFPHPTALALLLLDDHRTPAGRSAELVRTTLTAMADGGVYDQVGGGFHRYSVDEGWHIPHFEKMSADNAELLAAYADGIVRFHEPRFTEVARGIVSWARTVLADPAGGWGSSQDADNAPGDDGSYFTWSRAELKAALEADELRLAVRTFGIGTEGAMPHDPDRHVLYRMVPPEEAAVGLAFADHAPAALERVVAKLARVRSTRPAPIVDRALYADLNGRWIGAWARAAPLLGDPGLLVEARAAADRWIAGAVRPRAGVGHRLSPQGAEGFGLLEDQVSFAAGLVELAAAAGEPRYAEVATELLTLVDREFRGEDGLLRDVAPALYDGPGVGGIDQPSYPLEDSPHLSANSGAALAFLRLGTLVHDERWREKAAQLLVPIARRLDGAGLFGAGAAYVQGALDVPGATVVVEGSGPHADQLRAAARRRWHPNLFVFDRPPPPPLAPPTTGGDRPAAGARALVCFGNACAPPVSDPDVLARWIEAGRAPSPT